MLQVSRGRKPGSADARAEPERSPSGWGARAPSSIAAIGTGTLFACAVYWVPIGFFLRGVSPSGLFEESVGYRYFYSLRNVFGGEFPWLPQGQLPNLFHRSVQLALELAGYERADLTARVDAFSFLSVLGPIVATAWLAGALLARGQMRPLIVGGLFCSALLVFAPPAPHAWMVMPDYHVWTIPLALAATWLCVEREQVGSRGWGIAAGALVSACLWTKASYGVFAVPVLVIFGASLGWNRRSVERVLVLLGAASAVFVLIPALHYPDLRAVESAFTHFLLFSRTQGQTLPAGLDLWARFASEPMLWLATGVQPILLGFGLRWRRADAVGLAVGGGLSIAFVMLRNYSHSFIELHCYLLLELVVVVVWLDRAIVWSGARLAAAGAAVVALLMGFGGSVYAWTVRHPLSVMSYSMQLGDLSQQLEARLRSHERPVWMLTTGNGYRPNSIHSALCKGGTGMFDPYWGRSDYMVELFPTYHCAVVPDAVSQRDVDGAVVGFLHLSDEDLGAAIERVESYFGLSLRGRACSEVAGSAFGYFVCEIGGREG